MQSQKKKSVIEQTYRESSSEVGKLLNNDRLVKFFEILVQIDQKQRRNEKDN